MSLLQRRKSRKERQTIPEGIATDYAKTRLGHEAMMLGDAQALLTEKRRADRAQTNKAYGIEQAPDKGEEDVGGVHIGDQIVKGSPVVTAMAAAGMLGLAGIAGVLLYDKFQQKEVVQLPGKTETIAGPGKTITKTNSRTVERVWEFGDVIPPKE